MNNIEIQATKVFYKNRASKAQIVCNRGGSRSSKGQPLDEPILTPTGWRLIGDLKIGDSVYTQDGSIVPVVNVLNKGVRDCYKFIFDDNSTTIADYDHLWRVMPYKNRYKNENSVKHMKYRYNKSKLKTSLELFEYFNKYSDYKGFFIDNVHNIKFSEKDVPVDPYTLGVLLGDGYFGSEKYSYVYKAMIRLSCKDKEILDYLKVKYFQYPAQIKKGDYNILGIVEDLKKLGLLYTRSHNKFIPFNYLYNSIEVRKEILAGLLDTDGHCAKKGKIKKETGRAITSVYFTTVSEQLMKDIVFIVNSLSGKVFVNKRKGFYVLKGVRKYTKDYYSLCIKIPFNPFKLKRKAALYNVPYYTCDKILKKVEYIGQKECVCISVGHESGLYITRDFIVTHNSFSIAQLLLLERFFTQRNKKILVMRKTLPSLRLSAYQDWTDFLEKYKLYSVVKENKQFLDYWFQPNNNYLHFGSLDDAEKIKCFHPDTDIFTEGGWKNIKDVKLGEKVATLNPYTRVAEFLPITNFYEYDYNGKMLASGLQDYTHVRFCVTPDHRMLCYTLDDPSPVFIQAEGLKQDKQFCSIIATNKFKGVEYINYIFKKIVKHKNFYETKLEGKDFAKFLGMFYAKGQVFNNYVNFKFYDVSTTDKPLKELLEKLKIPYRIKKKFNKNVIIDSASFAKYLKGLFGRNRLFRKVPDTIKALDSTLLESFLQGVFEACRGKKIRVTNKECAESLFYILSKASYSYNYEYTKAGGVIVSCQKTYDYTYTKPLEIDYEGKVYCVEVAPYHTVMIRFKRESGFWCGQSTNWSYIWMQEATDFDTDDLLQLLLRLSAPTENNERNQLFMCFNPIDEYHWIKTKVLDTCNYDIEEIHSTYKDNQFLSEDYKKLIESYKDIDYNKYRVYGLGEWGKLENLIYNNWDVTDKYINEGEVIYGLDFGFTNPSALLKMVINNKDIFCEDIIYKTELTNSQLIEKCNELGVSKTYPIYADSAEPDRIKEFKDEGYHVIEANKDVINGIDFVKRFKLHIYKYSLNLKREIMGYSRMKDKYGNLKEEPIAINDHLMSCLRYGLVSHLRDRYNDIRLRFI